ncbi:laccase [Gelatoporia subvermispora B]|uniref:laccase n=1 Tax=Ceriporiopsis subvermispora (strain B) TaxID=914234 RepID=M2QJC0_CERS8|nr:laccase [Gelatoporia subvermispora B]
MTFALALRALVALGFVGGISAAIGPDTQLIISNKNIAPDGFTRATVLAGGTFPAPLIKGNKGDTFRINVVNELQNETMLKTTSIHWHGIFQHTTAWADGPAFVTQCPIASGDSFLYEFTVPDQAGTFWYHSHLATQYCDGLRGPLVVYDPYDPHKDLYDVDDENTVITLADWQHLAATVGPRFPMNISSTLINGLGRFSGDPTSELAVVSVEYGKRYRFRLTSISCEPNWNFTIDDHTMTVIEADAQNTEPLTVDQIQIFAAQRYSFVLHANQPIGNYWIRANPNQQPQGFDGGINSAILRYVGAPNEEPNTTFVQPVNPLNEANLHALSDPEAPGEPDQNPGAIDASFNLALGFDAQVGNFTIDGVSFIPPTTPVLLQILSGTQDAHDLMPIGSVFNISLGQSVQISFPIPPGGVPGGPHPFHLHGHTFSVVRSAGSDVYNYKNPVKRDTVSIGAPGDNVTIRFDANNPGPWFLHCHIDYHLNAGFAIVFAEDAKDIKAVNPVPPDWSKLCPIYDALPASDH